MLISIKYGMGTQISEKLPSLECFVARVACSGLELLPGAVQTFHSVTVLLRWILKKVAQSYVIPYVAL